MQNYENSHNALAQEQDEHARMNEQLMATLQQQDQAYWSVVQQLAEAKTKAEQYHEANRTLRRQVKEQQARTESAKTTSNIFEQMLAIAEKALKEEKELAANYKKELQELKQSAEKCSCRSPTTVSSWSMTEPTMSPTTVREVVSNPAQTQQHRMRKRKLTLSEEIDSQVHKSKRLRSSPAEPLSTSTPEISPLTSTSSVPEISSLASTSSAPELSPQSSTTSVAFECPSIDMRNVTGRSERRLRHYRRRQMWSAEA